MDISSENRSGTRPDHCAVAFKEWAAVCLALGAGQQLLILRKGGIHEGTEGFRVAHRWFWLYPTRFHESPGQLTPSGGEWLAPARHLAPPAGHAWLRHLVEVTDVVFLPSWTGLAHLDGWHGWSTETVRNRFEYRTPGLFALVVRVYQGDTPWELTETPAMAGCKSWVELDQPLATAAVQAVLPDDVFETQRGALCTALQSACSAGQHH